MHWRFSSICSGSGVFQRLRAQSAGFLDPYMQRCIIWFPVKAVSHFANRGRDRKKRSKEEIYLLTYLLYQLTYLPTYSLAFFPHMQQPQWVMSYEL